MASRYITELRISAQVEDKLAQRNIGLEDVLEVLWERPRFFRDTEPGRDKMIGPTYGGRMLTVIIEQSDDLPDVFDVVTGWESTKAQKTAWERAK